jgi:flavin-dependent dehydrogenase
MQAGRIAARAIHEMLAKGDLSERACSRYHGRWMAAFGREFPASALAARLTGRMPLLLDAANVVAQRRGNAFMERFGAAMTGMAPKTTFLAPALAGPLVLELVRQWLRRRGSPEAHWADGLLADPGRPTAFRNACLREQVEIG